MYIYLDLNIFDRLEKIERLRPEEAEPYKFLLHCFGSGVFITLYSHAHITDLTRAYNPEETTALEGHLRNIGALTKNLCVCLVDGDADVTLAEMDIFTYFYYVLEASENIGTTEDIMALFPEHFNDDSPIPPEMEKALENPLVQRLYPNTFKTRMMKSMLEDNIDAVQKMREDPSLFRDVKKMMNPANMSEFKKTLALGEKLDKEVEKNLKNLNFEAQLDKYGPKGKMNDNVWYDKIVNLYFRTDFKGYKTDREFTGLLVDAEHTFYASHCSIFITNDDRCHYKAKEVYKQLNLKTEVFTAKEFYDYSMSQLPSAD